LVKTTTERLESLKRLQTVHICCCISTRASGSIYTSLQVTVRFTR